MKSLFRISSTIKKLDASEIELSQLIKDYKKQTDSIKRSELLLQILQYADSAFWEKPYKEVLTLIETISHEFSTKLSNCLKGPEIFVQLADRDSIFNIALIGFLQKLVYDDSRAKSFAQSDLMSDILRCMCMLCDSQFLEKIEEGKVSQLLCILESLHSFFSAVLGYTSCSKKFIKSKLIAPVIYLSKLCFAKSFNNIYKSNIGLDLLLKVLQSDSGVSSDLLDAVIGLNMSEDLISFVEAPESFVIPFVPQIILLLRVFLENCIRASKPEAFSVFLKFKGFQVLANSILLVIANPSSEQITNFFEITLLQTLPKWVPESITKTPKIVQSVCNQLLQFSFVGLGSIEFPKSFGDSFLIDREKVTESFFTSDSKNMDHRLGSKEAFTALVEAFVSCKHTGVRILILEVFYTLFQGHPDNFFLSYESGDFLKVFRTISIESNVAEVVSLLKLLEWSCTSSRFVPLSELRYLQEVLQSCFEILRRTSTPSSNEHIISLFRYLLLFSHSLLDFHPAFQNVFQELGLLKMLTEIVNSEFLSLKKKEEFLGKDFALVASALKKLLYNSSSNLQCFRLLNIQHDLYGMLEDSQRRSYCLYVLDDQVDLENVSQLLVLLQNFEVNLGCKEDVLKSLIHMVAKGQQSQTVFRDAGGFEVLISLLSSLEFVSDRLLTEQIVQSIFRLITVAITDFPLNRAYFWSNIGWTALSESLVLIKASQFSKVLDILFHLAVENVDDIDKSPYADVDDFVSLQSPFKRTSISGTAPQVLERPHSSRFWNSFSLFARKKSMDEEIVFPRKLSELNTKSDGNFIVINAEAFLIGLHCVVSNNLERAKDFFSSLLSILLSNRGAGVHSSVQVLSSSGFLQHLFVFLSKQKLLFEADQRLMSLAHDVIILIGGYNMTRIELELFYQQLPSLFLEIAPLMIAAYPQSYSCIEFAPHRSFEAFLQTTPFIDPIVSTDGKMRSFICSFVRMLFQCLDSDCRIY